jgi:hypothetical protein
MGAVKTMTTDLTDETNNARGFSLLPLSWSFGYVIGFVVSFAFSQFLPDFGPLVP